MAITILSRQQQLEFDIGKKNGTAGSRQQQRAAQEASRTVPQPSVITGPRNPFQPRLQTSFEKVEKLHLRSKLIQMLPLDVRRIIWRFLVADTKKKLEQDGNWAQVQKREHAALYATCQLLYKEMHYVEFEAFLVTQNRIREMTTMHIFRDGIDRNKVTGVSSLKSRSVAVKDFTTLVIEIPLTANRKDLITIKLVISLLPLKHLKIKFTGPDDYGNPTVAAFSCGLRPEESSRRLPAAGQLFRHRADFINSLSKLVNLESLVVSNANLPVTYNQVVNNKAKLKKLYIVADSRSGMTYDWHNAAQNHNDPTLQATIQGCMIPLNTIAMPPLLELVISANSMLYAPNLVRHALRGLKKLTWIVPNPCHQAGELPGANINFIGQTSKVIEYASVHGIQLELLRICIEPPVVDTHEGWERNDKVEVAALVNSLNTALKGIDSLKRYEIHMNYNPQFELDGFAFATNSPDNLEHFYVSEQTFVKDNDDIPFSSIPVVKPNFAFGPPTSEDHPSNNPIPKSVSVHHELVRQVTIDNFRVPSFSLPGFSTRTYQESPYPKFEDDTALTTPYKEECLPPRSDRIPYSKHLAFLHYEFTDTSHNLLRTMIATDAAPITQPEDLAEVDEDRFRLLRLNGRLLDRERNKHLFADGYRPRIVVDDGKDVVVAKAEGLAPRKYPVVVRWGHGEGEGHWMCEA